MTRRKIRKRIKVGDLRFLIISELRRLLASARQREETAAGGYVRRELASLIRRQTLAEVNDQLETEAGKTTDDFPQLADRATRAREAGALVEVAKTGHEVLELINGIASIFGLPGEPDGDGKITIEADVDALVLNIEGEDDEAGDERDAAADEDDYSSALGRVRSDHAFLVAVARRIARVRDDRSEVTCFEGIAVAIANYALEAGNVMPPAFRGIGTYGFRDYQTSLSLADPGDGHLSVTCTSNDLLAGTVVHVEHIDRDGVKDRERVEAYRLPAAINAARVRLMLGTAAPCTAYIGRPVFENSAAIPDGGAILLASDFKNDLLKSAHLTASACTAMFINGIADCKIAMERMTAVQMVEFMGAVAGNVMRDGSRQFLSAAFNVNVPILDDFNRESVRWVTTPFEIGRLAIDLTLAGRFDKVTWDGATNQVPSTPIVRQLSHAQWVTLIHVAHEVGLETYMSAGLEPPHMRDCVHTAVDGVGIGTSLHHNPAGKPMGQLKPEAILETLAVRDAAAADPVGQAAVTLARLDRMLFERIIPDELDKLRLKLFGLLAAADTDHDVGAIEVCVEEIRRSPFWSTMADLQQLDTDAHPMISRARRFLQAKRLEPALPDMRIRARRTAQLEATEAVDDVALVEQLVASGDITGLIEVMR